MFSLGGRHVALFTESSLQLVRLRFAEQNSTLLLASAQSRRRRGGRLLLVLLLMLMMMMVLMMMVVEIGVGGAGELFPVTVRVRILFDGVVCVFVDLCRLRTDVCNITHARAHTHTRQLRSGTTTIRHRFDGRSTSIRLLAKGH